MNSLRKWLKNSRIRSALVILILIATLAVFVRFFSQHPEYVTRLRHIKLWQVLAIMGLNLGAIISLSFVTNFSLELCGKKLSIKEQFLLTSYSSIANFFGPLQSGPGVRMIYLKTRHKLSMRNYLFATLIYYAIFAIISMLFLTLGYSWWQSLGAVILVSLVCWASIKLLVKRSAKKGNAMRLQFSSRAIIGLIIATLAQICFISGYYFVELAIVKSHASLRQAVVYSGAANFAIFVSLTPDAIGFREAFLVLSKRLHRISTPFILAANLIDRAIYALFLGILFLFVLAFHVQDRFKSLDKVS